MSSILKASKLLSPSHVIEHGLLVGVILVLMNAAITLETIEIMTGVVGAVAVCVMKENGSWRRNCDAKAAGKKACKLDCKIASCEIADKTPRRDTDLAQLEACVQAELSVLRAECKLESMKKKAEAAEAERAQLHDKVAALEHDLSQVNSAQSWTDGEAPEMQVDKLLTELTEAKLRIEEVEAELVQAQTNVADLESDVAQATLIRSGAEKTAQARIEALSTSADQVAADVAGGMGIADDN